MGRGPCYSKEGLNRGAWTAHEDQILREYIRVHGEGKWRNLPKRAGLKRCGKSCRLRWLNYLRPNIKRGNISPDEEDLIIRLHKLLGNRWSLIAGRLPGRTDNEIKNYWNCHLGKKVKDCHQSIVSHTQTTERKTQDNPMPQLTPNVTPSPSPSLSQTQPRLVPTKATKCSKVLVVNTLHHSSMQLQNMSETEAETLLVDAVANISTSNQLESSTYDDGSFSFPCKGTDFDMGGICSSDLVNLDFSDICDFNYNNKISDEQPPCLETYMLFSEESFMDWTQSNFAHETCVDNDIHSFISFMDPTGNG